MSFLLPRTLITAASLAATALLTLPGASQAAGIDANTFIVGHPASPRWVAAPHQHANGEHPAVLQQRQAQRASIDSNQFLVQPPASTHWQLASTPDAPAQLALAATATPLATR